MCLREGGCIFARFASDLPDNTLLGRYPRYLPNSVFRQIKGIPPPPHRIEEKFGRGKLCSSHRKRIIWLQGLNPSVQCKDKDKGCAVCCCFFGTNQSEKRRFVISF